MLAFKLILLLLMANAAPVLAQNVLGDRWARAVDGNVHLADGRPLLGKSKTWRGLLAALLSCALLGPALGFGLGFSLMFAAASMLGDMLSSFSKRRLGLAASARATGLDQIPESLLPMLLGMAWLDYGFGTVLLSVLVFSLLDVWLSPWLHRLGLRRRPY